MGDEKPGCEIKTLKSINEVNLFRAEEITAESEVDEFYKKSGLRLINEILEKAFDLGVPDSKFEAVFFEFSTLASIMRNNKLLAFTSLYDSTSPQKYKPLIEDRIASVWNNIQKSGSTIYYHNEFFRKPSEPVYHFSQGLDEAYSTPDKAMVESFKKRFKDVNEEESRIPFHDTKFKYISVANTTIQRNLQEFEEASGIQCETYKDVPVSRHHFFTYKSYLEHFKVDAKHTIFVSFPLLGAPATLMPQSKTNKCYSGYGAFFILAIAKSPLLPVSNGEKTKMQNALFEINELINRFTIIYLMETGKELGQTAIREAMKSTMAAIMARNISHNLGSHVLSYVKSNLTSTKTMLLSGVMDNFIRAEKMDKIPGSGMEKDKFTISIPEKGENFEFDFTTKFAANNSVHFSATYLLGLGHLINYIQERQDYIATVASGTCPYFSSLNFKDHILDEFAHDAKSKRHPDNHEPQRNLLLEYLARSEGFTRIVENNNNPVAGNIEIRFVYNKILRHELVKDSVSLEYSSFNTTTKIDDALRRVEVDVPAGIMGRQAVYSILENIIRNSAKHCAKSKTRRLVFTMEFTDYADDPVKHDYYEVVIYDNSNNYYDALEEQGENKISRLHKKIQKGLEFTDFQSGDKDSSKGLKEMLISAGWLRNIILDDLNNNKSLPVLTPVNKNGNLGFCLYLFKSHKIAFVVPSDQKKNLENLPAGFHVFSMEEILANTFSFKLIVIDNQLKNEPPVKDIRKKYISRLMFSDLEKVKNDGIIGNEHKLEEFFYDKFREYICRQFERNVADLPVILIRDTVNHESQKGKLPEKVIITKQSEEVIPILRSRGCLVFRTHNDTATEFNSFMEGVEKSPGALQNLLFIEGISGHNSTDRLIRYEEKNELWYLQMIESGLTNILIIDERQWQKITGIDPLGVRASGLDYKAETIIKIINNYEEEDFNGIEAGLKEQYPTFDLDLITELYVSRKDEKKITRLLEPKRLAESETQIDDIIKNNKNYDILKHKNIEVVDFIARDDGSFQAYNLRKKVGQIMVTESNINVSFEKEFEASGFDFVVIHQGILDKLFKDKKENIRLRFNNITDAFNGPDGSLKTKFIIHSGRSQPPKNQFPENTPFIQYSSIENSLADCKFTLSQLLYSAINQ